MKKIILLLILSNIKPLEFWTEVGDGSSEVVSMTISGPNQEYIVQGRYSIYKSYRMDWESGKVSLAKEIDVGENPIFDHGVKVQSDSGYNIVAASATIFRFSIDPQKEVDFEEYPVFKKHRCWYGYPFWAETTNYMFVSARTFKDIENKNLYRLHSDHVKEVKSFQTGSNSRSYGVLFETPWVVVSLHKTDQRAIYDYTSGGEEGSNNPVRFHSKESGFYEVGFFSPKSGQGKGYYVVGAQSRDRRVCTISHDGENRLQRNFLTFERNVHNPHWIPETQLCVVASWGPDFAIVDFMDTSKPDASYYTLPGTAKSIYQPQVWKHYRAIVLSSVSEDRSYVYKAFDEMSCSGLCVTCRTVFRSKCEACAQHSTRFGDSCKCDIGYYDNFETKSKKECRPCDSSCKTCEGDRGDQCLSCRVEGYALESSKCVSCSDKDLLNCPQETIMSSPNELEELSQNFTIVFKPSLNTPNRSITNKTLTTTYLTISYKRKETPNESPLTVLENKLTHQGENQSTLFIRFLQKMRLKNTEYIKISVKDPWLYRPDEKKDNGPRLIYLKKSNQLIITIKEKEMNSGERTTQKVTKAAQVTRAAMAASATASISAAAFTGGTGSSLVYLINFLNILEVIANLSKMNTKLGSRMLLVVNFIQNLKLPQVGFISNLSPLKDKDPEDEDSDAYMLIPRGTRGKITTENSEVFITSGQNFLMSTVIVSSWVLMKLLELCLNNNSKILGWVSFIYHVLIGMAFFDYQLICSAEVSLFDYSGLRRIPLKFIISCLMSHFIIFLIVIHYIEAYSLIKIKICMLRKVTKQKNQEEKDQNIISSEEKIHTLKTTPQKRLILSKYTDELMMGRDTAGPHLYLTLIENIRFFIIQIVIASLQLLNRVQSLIILLINLVFFLYFFKIICKHKVFKSKLLLVKTVVQECCVMIAIVMINLFSLTASIEKAPGSVLGVVEILAIISIIGAAGAELFLLVYTIGQQIVKGCRKVRVQRVQQKEKSKKRKSNNRRTFQANEAVSESREILQSQLPGPDMIKNKKCTKSLKSRNNRIIEKQIEEKFELQENQQPLRDKKHKKSLHKRKHKKHFRKRSKDMRAEGSPSDQRAMFIQNRKLKKERKEQERDSSKKDQMEKNEKRKRGKMNKRKKKLFGKKRPIRSQVKELKEKRADEKGNLRIQKRFKGYLD